MPNLRLTRIFCVLFICLAPAALSPWLAKVHAAPPPSAYCVTDLGSLNNEETRANDLNNSTEVVGTSWVGTFIDHPFYWKNGALQDLGTVIGGSSTSANRISEYGVIVGTGKDVNGVDQAYYKFTASSWWRTIFHPGDSAVGWGVNDGIQMVGTYRVFNGPEAGRHPYVFHPRFGIFDLGQVGGAGRGEAFIINNKPQVGGTSQALVGDCGTSGNNTPVIWEETSFGNWNVTILPTAGRCHAGIMAINESDVAVGFTQSLFPSPVVWRHGHSWIIQFLEAGDLGLGAAMDVNESGQIVGFTDAATLWTNTGQRHNLNNLVDAPEWNLATATAINDQGEITGTGSLDGAGTRAYLLTPKPPFVSCS